MQKDTLKELCRLMNIDEIEIEREGGERGEKERDIYLYIYRVRSLINDT